MMLAAQPRHIRWFAVLCLLAWAVFAPRVHATTAQACTMSPSGATITIPAVTLTSSQTTGLIGSAGTVQVTFNCPTGTTAYNGTKSHASIQTIISGSGIEASNGVLYYPTNVAGLYIQLTLSVANPHAGGLQVGSGNEIFKVCESGDTDPECKTANAPSSVATFTAQLYVQSALTGESGVVSITPSNGALISGFENYTGGYSNSSSTYGSLTVNAVNLTFPTCAGNSPTVTLPTLDTNTLNKSGVVAGATQFQISLTNCPAGVDANIAFTGTAYSTTTNVLASTGTASNVQVQLLDGGNNMQPVNIKGTTTDLSTVPASGSITRNYYAQYYASGQSTAGTVKATATYTITYP
jgi:type 1 fimbria pilin